MKTFIITFWTSLILTALVNYIVDPTGKRTTRYNLPIPEGKVLVGNNIDERLLKKQMFEEMQADTYIIGSSRVLYGFDSNFFNFNTKVLNLGVGAGTIFDYKYFLDRLPSRSGVKDVYIELTPWTFPQMNEQNKSFFDISCPINESHILCDKKQNLEDFKNSIKELLSIAHTRETFKLLKGHRVGSFALEGDDTSGYTKDGRRYSDKKYRDAPQQEIYNRVLKQMNQKKLNNFETGIDDLEVRQFCKAIIKLREKMIKATIFILPFNPMAKEIINNRKLGYTIDSKIFEIKDRVESLCSSEFNLNLEVKMMGDICLKDDFFDSTHFKESCFNKVKAALVNK